MLAHAFSKSLAKPLTRTVALATAAALILGVFTTEKAQARGLGLGVGIGLGLIAASQMARASRERASAPRHVESERSYRKARVVHSRSSRDDDEDEAEERRAAAKKAKAKQQAEAKAEIAKMQGKLEKTKVAESKEETPAEATPAKTKTVADLSLATKLDRLTAEVGREEAKRFGNVAAADTEPATVGLGPAAKSGPAVGSAKLDCKRFVPAAGMTVSVACGN